MKKFIYVGAYIEVGNLAEGDFEPYRMLQDYMNGDVFDRFYEKFVFPYQGMEGYNILMPIPDKSDAAIYGEHKDEYEEHVWSSDELKNMFSDGAYEQSFTEAYSEIIEEIKSVVGSENVHIKSGIIDYWDERG